MTTLTTPTFHQILSSISAQVRCVLLLRNFAFLTFAADTRLRLAAILSAQAAQRAAQLVFAVVQPSAKQQVEAFLLDMKAVPGSFIFDGASFG